MDTDDRGASFVEYLVLGVVAALILGGLATFALPGRIGAGVTAAICRMIGASSCPSGRTGAGDGPRTRAGAGSKSADAQGLDACMVSSDNRTVTSEGKVLFYKHSESKGTLVQRQRDGSVAVTHTNENANGVDVKLGVGAKLGRVGLNVGVGGGGMWPGRATDQMSFPSEKAHKQYDALVKEKQKDLAKRFGPMAFTKKDSAKDAAQRTWNRRHRGSGQKITRSTMHAHGYGWNFGGDVSVGIKPPVGKNPSGKNPLGNNPFAKPDPAGKGGGKPGAWPQVGGDGGADGTQMSGAQVNDNGTPGNKDDDTTTEYSESANSGNGGGGFTAPSDLGAGYHFSKDSLTSSALAKDKDGKPTQLTLVTQRGWTHAVKGSGSASDARDRANGSASGGGSKGGIVNETTVVDLKKNPGVAELWKKTHELNPMNNGSDLRRDNAMLRRLIPKAGRRSVMRYTRSSSDNGQEASLSAGLELAAAKHNKKTDHWSLTDAERQNPRTRAMEHWRACDRHDSIWYDAPDPGEQAGGTFGDQSPAARSTGGGG